MLKGCKYCKDKTHLIDNCPLIICRLCNVKGHVDWNCPNHKEKKNKNKNRIKRNNDNKNEINLNDFPKLKEKKNIEQKKEQKIEQKIDYSNMSWVEINSLVY